MSDTVAVIRDAWKCYAEAGEKTQVLSGANMTVERGETVALQGVSGSGKSTLLAVIAGLTRLDSGAASLRGRDLGRPDSGLPLHRARTIGLVLQRQNLLLDLTVLENVLLPARIAGLGEADARARAESALRAVGLEGHARRRPRSLSGGEAQRVAVARAVMHSPALIVADEPTASLDRANAQRVIELLLRLSAQEGAALLIATHDGDVAARCARRLVIDAGIVREPA